jgi:hypothetical protein
MYDKYQYNSSTINDYVDKNSFSMYIAMQM